MNMSLHQSVSSAPHRGPYTRTTIILISMLVAALVTLISASLISWRRYETIRNADIELSNLGSLLSTQIHLSFQTIDFVERQLISELRAASIDSSESLRKATLDRRLNDRLKAVVSDIEMLDGAAIIDNTGHLLTTSRVWPTPVSDLSDRDYFRALSTNPDLPSVWSGPARNRIDGDETIFNARSFRGSKEQLLGVILTGLSVRRLQEYFRSIALPPRSGVALIRGRQLLAASSNFKTDEGFTTWVARVADAAPGKEVIFESFKSTLHSTLIAAVDRVPGTGFIVVVSVPKDVVLAKWHTEALCIAMLWVGLILAICIACLLGLRHVDNANMAFKLTQHAARHDHLTRLPNRSYFDIHLARMLSTSADDFQNFSLLLIDLDSFKEVNDLFGHAAGDMVLAAVCRRLLAACGEHDTLARLGGDEFAVLHPGEGDANRLAQHIQDALEAPVEFLDAEVRVRCSIGIASACAPFEKAEQLLSQADLALYQAKDDGRNVIRHYTEALGAMKDEQKALVRDLAKAIETSTLHLVYQPIVNIKQRRIVAFEALLRWKHPERGYVAPSRFIPLAEERGLIGQLGSWVLNEACRDAAGWPGGINVAVNLSPVQLRTQDVFAETYAALSESTLSPSRLQLEITESVHLDQSGAGETLSNLRELGVGVSLDDFGTGYASLSYLRSFPFDLIKIDQSFVREMRRSTESEVIVQTVLALGERLGISVVAEGVETIDQLNYLHEHGCTKAQGYLLGRPMTVEKVAGFVDSWRYPTPDASLKLVYSHRK